jgi:hypothetical protein
MFAQAFSKPVVWTLGTALAVLASFASAQAPSSGTISGSRPMSETVPDAQSMAQTLLAPPVFHSARISERPVNLVYAIDDGAKSDAQQQARELLSGHILTPTMPRQVVYEAAVTSGAKRIGSVPRLSYGDGQEAARRLLTGQTRTPIHAQAGERKRKPS